jgi:hypothetical protein
VAGARSSEATLRLEVRRARLISRFVDAYLNLNAEEDREFQRALSKLTPDGMQKEKFMAYVTSWERTGMRIGRRDEAQRITRRLVRAKFGAVNRMLMKRIDSLSMAKKERLAEALFTLKTLADLEAWLNRR